MASATPIQVINSLTNNVICSVILRDYGIVLSLTKTLIREDYSKLSEQKKRLIHLSEQDVLISMYSMYELTLRRYLFQILFLVSFVEQFLEKSRREQ